MDSSFCFFYLFVWFLVVTAHFMLCFPHFLLKIDCACLKKAGLCITFYAMLYFFMLNFPFLFKSFFNFGCYMYFLVFIHNLFSRWIFFSFQIGLHWIYFKVFLSTLELAFSRLAMVFDPRVLFMSIDSVHNLALDCRNSN